MLLHQHKLLHLRSDFWGMWGKAAHGIFSNHCLHWHTDPHLMFRLAVGWEGMQLPVWCMASILRSHFGFEFKPVKQARCLSKWQTKLLLASNIRSLSWCSGTNIWDFAFNMNKVCLLPYTFYCAEHVCVKETHMETSTYFNCSNKWVCSILNLRPQSSFVPQQCVFMKVFLNFLHTLAMR